jgi:hypothetical protein
MLTVTYAECRYAKCRYAECCYAECGSGNATVLKSPRGAARTQQGQQTLTAFDGLCWTFRPFLQRSITSNIILKLFIFVEKAKKVN